MLVMEYRNPDLRHYYKSYTNVVAQLMLHYIHWILICKMYSNDRTLKKNVITKDIPFFNLRLMHTPQEQRNVFVSLKCRTPGKSSKGPATAAHVTRGGKRIKHAHFKLTNHTIVLAHDTRKMFCPDDVSRTSCENSRTRAARTKWRHSFLAALGERTHFSVLAEYVSAFSCEATEVVPIRLISTPLWIRREKTENK